MDNLGNAKRRGICLALLIGIPGSGKSYLTSKLVGYTNSHGSLNSCRRIRVVPVSYDDYLLYNEDGCSLDSKWKDQRSGILQSVEEFISYLIGCCNEFSNKLNLNYNCQDTLMDEEDILIVIDDNMYYRSMRYEYFKLAKKYQTSFCQIFINASLGRAIDSNNSREESKKVPESLIKRMSVILEQPDIFRNKWERFTLEIQPPFVDLNQIFNMIHTCLEYSEFHAHSTSPIVETVKTKNLIHEVDVVLRKVVGQLVRTSQKHLIKDTVKRLNCRKVGILKELKNGDLILPLEIAEILTSDCTDADKNSVNNYFVDLLSG